MLALLVWLGLLSYHVVVNVLEANIIERLDDVHIMLLDRLSNQGMLLEGGRPEIGDSLDLSCLGLVLLGSLLSSLSSLSSLSTLGLLGGFFVKRRAGKIILEGLSFPFTLLVRGLNLAGDNVVPLVVFGGLRELATEEEGRKEDKEEIKKEENKEETKELPSRGGACRARGTLPPKRGFPHGTGPQG